MDFLKETDMKSVHRVAIELLNEEPLYLGNGFVLHPFISDDQARIDGQYFNIFENDSLWEEWQALMATHIFSSGIDDLILLIKERYRMSFVGKVSAYLTKQDFSNALSEAYTHGILNDWCSIDDALEWFENADKISMMCESEMEFYDSLPNEIVIYRGQKTDDGIDGISWSIDKNVARKFAKRIAGGGCLLKAKVNKSDILAYFDRREESEVIVDYENVFELKFLKK